MLYLHNNHPTWLVSFICHIYLDSSDHPFHNRYNIKHFFAITTLHFSNPRSHAVIQRHAQTKSKLQRKLRHMEDSWQDAKAGEVQALSDRGDSRRVFQSLKSIYGPRQPTSSPMLTADGNTLLTSKPDILSRWKDYYATLLNRPSEINDQILESIQQCPIRDELGEFLTK